MRLGCAFYGDRADSIQRRFSPCRLLQRPRLDSWALSARGLETFWQLVSTWRGRMSRSRRATVVPPCRGVQGRVWHGGVEALDEFWGDNIDRHHPL